MACCEKLKYERLADINHASVLACQEANVRKVHIAVVKKVHKSYGSYYIGVDYEEAKRTKVKIFREYKPGDTMAVQKRNSKRGSKVSSKA